MNRFLKFSLRLMAVLLALHTVPCLAQQAIGSSSSPTQAATSEPDKTGKLSLLLSPYTVHFDPEPRHRDVYLIGLEKNYIKRQSSWIGLDYDFTGLSYFSNSFGQPSAYGYFGRTYWPTSNPKLFVKVSAGLIYGYKGEFKDKAGGNFGGFTPVILPSLGWVYDEKHTLQVNVLGGSGAMFMLTRSLD